MNAPKGTNTPGTVDGVPYSGHAFDQMQGRGLTPSAIKSVIENGKVYPTGSGTIGYYDALTNVRVITNSLNGIIITIIPGKP